jgi:hypothetical protein
MTKPMTVKRLLSMQLELDQSATRCSRTCLPGRARCASDFAAELGIAV